VAGLFGYWAMRDPAAPNPLPRAAAARRAAGGERGGLLAHLGRPKRRSGLRVREPRRLPRGLDGAETAALLGSFRTDRDRAIAGLMLFCGLRSAEVLGLEQATPAVHQFHASLGELDGVPGPREQPHLKEAFEAGDRLGPAGLGDVQAGGAGGGFDGAGSGHPQGLARDGAGGGFGHAVGRGAAVTAIDVCARLISRRYRCTSGAG
jgi:hypothetical protein